jgi:hypothetical protein
VFNPLLGRKCKHAAQGSTLSSSFLSVAMCPTCSLRIRSILLCISSRPGTFPSGLLPSQSNLSFSINDEPNVYHNRQWMIRGIYIKQVFVFKNTVFRTGLLGYSKSLRWQGKQYCFPYYGHRRNDVSAQKSPQTEVVANLSSFVLVIRKPCAFRRTNIRNVSPSRITHSCTRSRA